MADIASLILKVDAQQVDKGTQSLSDLQKQAQKTEQAAVKLGKEIGTTLAVGITTAGTATFMLVRNAINAADAMNDLNLKTGIAFKNLAAYDLLARQSGTSIEGVAQSFKFLGKYMVEHSDKLEYIGVTSKDSTAAMGQFADAIAGIKDPTLKTAVAMEVLGRSGAEMLPMLSGGSEAFKKAQEQTKAYGEALERVAPKADEFNDGISRMEIAGKVVGLTLAEKLLPTLLAVSDAMLESSVNSGLVEKWGTSLAWILKGVAVTAINVAYVLTQIGNEIGGIAAQAAAFLTGNFSEAKRIGEMMKADAAAARIEVDKMTDSILNAEDAKKKDTAAAGEQSKSMDEYARRLLQGNEAADKARKAEDSRQKSITDMIESLEKEAATFGKTTAQIKLYELALLKASPAQVKAAQAAIDRIDALQREKDAKEAIFNAEADYIKSINDDTESIIENNKKMAEHIGNIGKTKEEIALLASERENSAIKIAEETLATSDAIGIHNAETEALRENIKARKDRRDLFIQASSAHAALAQVKEIERAETDRWKMVDSLAHDTFMNITNKGKNAFKEIGDAIKKYLLEMLYKMTVQKWLISVGMTGAGGMAAGAAQAAGSVMGGNTAGFSMPMTPMSEGLEKFRQTSIGNNLFGGGVDEAGYAEAVLRGEDVTREAFKTATTDFGSAAQSFSSAVDSYGGYVNAAYQLTQGKPWQAIGSAIGQYFGGPIGATIGNYIGSLIGGNKGVKEVSLGNLGQEFSPTGQVVRTDYNKWSTGDVGADKLAALEKAYQSLASSIGAQTVNSYFAYGANNGGPNGAMQFAMRGGAGGTSFYQQETAASEGAIQLAASRAVFTALQGSKLTDDIAKLFKGLSASAMTEQELNDVINKAQKMHNAIASAQADQATIARGLVNDPNQQTKDLAEGFAALNIAVPKTNQEFADLINGLNVTTVAGQGTLAALKFMVPTFNDVQSAAKKAAEELAKQMLDVDTALAQIGMSELEKQLNAITVATTAAMAKAAELAATESDLTKIRELGVKQAQAAINAAATSAYTTNLTAQGREKEALNFDIGVAKSAYTSAIHNIAVLANKTDAQVAEYVAGYKSVADAGKAFFGELGDASDITSDRFRALTVAAVEADTVMRNKQTAIDNMDKQIAKDARDAQEKAAQDARDAQEKAAQDAAATAATLLTWQNQLDVLQGKKTQKEIDRAELLSSVSDKTTLSVMRQVFALQDLAAVSDVSTENTDAAMAAVKQAIDAQKKILQVTRDTADEQIKAIKSVMDTLRDGIKTLRGEVTGSVLQSGADGMDFIANALNNAKSSGYLPDQAQLQDAISSATAGLDAKLYTSKLDADRDRLRLANQLEAINAIGGDQLTTSEKALLIAENQLKDLDDQLVAAQAQIDLLRGINSGVTSVTAAIASLGAAISAEAAARTAAMVPVGNVAPAVVGAAASAIAAPSMDLTVGGTNFAAQNLLGIAGMSAAAAANQVSSIIATSDAATAAAISGYAHSAGIPGFATGTSYVPYDMTANIHEGEEITPRPYVDRQRASRDETNELLARLVSSNDEMRAELKAVKLELAHIKNTNNRMMQTSEKWDTDGIPAQRV